MSPTAEQYPLLDVVKVIRSCARPDVPWERTRPLINEGAAIAVMSPARRNERLFFTLKLNMMVVEDGSW